jgi:hypothetical protein
MPRQCDCGEGAKFLRATLDRDSTVSATVAASYRESAARPTRVPGCEEGPGRDLDHQSQRHGWAPAKASGAVCRTKFSEAAANSASRRYARAHRCVITSS